MSNKVSVIVPVYNERENLPELLCSLTSTLEVSGEDYEIVFVNDGSTDGSGTFLETIPASNRRIKLVQFARNFGQTAALAAGIDHAAGDILIATDADDPADIPLVLAKLREGFDVVSCWRRERQNTWLTRRFPSRLANWLISKISGVQLHDYGCTLKGYRKSVLEHIRLYGEMHRFIPIYASWAGASVAEMPVKYRPRTRGSSKYGLSRIYKVALDLITVKMLGNYSTKPMYFFGGAGLVACTGGILFALWTLIERFLGEVKADRNPLLLLAVFLFLLGIQFIMMGLVAELLIRTYFESQDKPPYIVRRTWNCIEPETPGRDSSDWRNQTGGIQAAEEKDLSDHGIPHTGA